MKHIRLTAQLQHQMRAKKLVNLGCCGWNHAVCDDAGANKLCVVHVDDAVRGYMSFLTHKDARGAYNIAGQNGITSKAIAETIASKLNCSTASVSMEEAQHLFGPFIATLGSMNSQADCSKALHELGWKPQHLDFHDKVTPDSF